MAGSGIIKRCQRWCAEASSSGMAHSRMTPQTVRPAHLFRGVPFVQLRCNRVLPRVRLQTQMQLGPCCQHRATLSRLRKSPGSRPRKFTTELQQYQLSTALRARLQEKLERYQFLLDAASSEGTGSPGVSSQREQMEEMARLQPVADLMQQLHELDEEHESLMSLKDESDIELRQMAEEEVVINAAARATIEQQLLISMIPVDEAEAGNAVLEIRSGAGGDEASLFAEDLCNMYMK